VTQPSDLPTADKDALIARNKALVAELEAKLELPPKTPGNLSVPPSKGQKPSGASTPKAKAKPHPGAHRPLHPNPTTKRDVLAKRHANRVDPRSA
jgi:transposase